MKKEAAKVARDEAAATRKAEAERKKVAKQTTKKTLQISTKLCQPLTNAFTTAYDAFTKAQVAGLEANTDVIDLKQEVDKVEKWRKACSSALGYYTKNAKAELDALEFTMEEGNEAIKKLGTLSREVRKILADQKKAAPKAKAAAGGGA